MRSKKAALSRVQREPAGGAGEHRLAAGDLRRRRVLERRRGVVRQLAHQREGVAHALQPVVGAGTGLDDGRGILVQRSREILVGVLDREQLVDRWRQRLQIRHLGLAAMQRQSLAGDQPVQRGKERRTRMRHVEVDPAEAGVVQRVEHLRPHALHHPHDRRRLGRGRGEAQRLVVDGEAPLDLLAVRRPVELERIAQRRERALHPALVQHEAVGVRDRDREERDVELRAQRVVLAQEARQEIDGQRADGLVRMRHADQQDGPPPVPDREQLDRPVLGRRADGLQARDAGKLRHEGAGAPSQLVEREELRVVGNAGQRAGQVVGHAPVSPA